MVKAILSPEVIDELAVVKRIRSEQFGAELIFNGIVRSINKGREVLSISYDADVPLAENILKAVGEEGLASIKSDGIVFIQHRTGEVKAGESSLVIAVSTKHRSEAYELSRYCIEQLKARAPIWKKEIYQDGQSEWLDGTVLCGCAQGHSHG